MFSEEYHKVVFSSFSYFSNTLSEVNLNILGLYKAFWYTGSAFTKYFNHNSIRGATIVINDFPESIRSSIPFLCLLMILNDCRLSIHINQGLNIISLWSYNTNILYKEAEFSYSCTILGQELQLSKQNIAQSRPQYYFY